MKENLFDGVSLSEEEMLENLRAECSTVEEHVFVKPFTESELSELKENYIEKQSEIRKKQQKLKEVAEPIKAEIKALSMTLDREIKQIKDKGREIRDDLFGMPDFDSGMMNFYDDHGKFIFSRRLKQEEKQHRLNYKAS